MAATRSRRRIAIPPDDQVEIFETRERDGMIVAGYAWLRDVDRQAGEMRISPRNGEIERLVVTFD